MENADEHAFERDKVCYEQNFEQFRSMNQSMWQVPLLSVTITGGLWFAALTMPEAENFRRPLLLLSAVLNFALIAVLWRVRYVMEAYLDQIKAFNPPAFAVVTSKGLFSSHYTVIWSFTAALLFAAIASALGFLNLDWLRFGWLG